MVHPINTSVFRFSPICCWSKMISPPEGSTKAHGAFLAHSSWASHPAVTSTTVSSNPSNPSVMSPLCQVRWWSDSHSRHPVHPSVPTMTMTHVSLHKLQIPKLISGVVTNDVQMFSWKNPLSQPWPQPVLQKTPVNPSDHSVGELSTLAVGKQGPTSWLHFRYSTRW